MALDVASLTLDDSQASLASMPEELWRKVTSYLRPATRSLQSHADDPRPPGPTADNPSGGFEAFARSLM